ncbi:MAG TPA: NAD(+) synthase [Acidobacteria bacterium]|nr:NAD(+) synthase [Acidobacteriota bacterium]
MVLPELALPGYPPRDLLLDPAFVDRTLAVTAELARELAGSPPILVGTLARSGSTTPGHPGLWNAAALLRDGTVAAVVAKRLLPAYDVFHETRWFCPGPPSSPLDIAGRRVGVLICEDLWDEGYPDHPAAELAAAGADLLITISSSPYRGGILPRRLYHAARTGLPLVYVNAVGANDELIFDGRSFVMDEKGALAARLPGFREAVEVVDLEASPAPEPLTEPPPEEELFEALCLGVRDFVAKNNLRRVFLGLSGGVDSALVACIAAAAVGPGAVTALALPSRHTDPRSTECARELAELLGIRFEVHPLEPLHAAARASLAPLLDAAGADTVDENLQARLRMLVLTAWVNRHGGLLLNTSNKTELALGYGTLYGDLGGTLSVLGDVTKPAVYALARWVAAHRVPIPPFILDRPPTAELKPDQIDPFDYPTVAPAVEALVLGERPEIDPAPWQRRLHAAEHKRRHHGLILKVTERAFGTGRMMPVTRR